MNNIFQYLTEDNQILRLKCVKKYFENWLEMQERTIPRSKSEVSSTPAEQQQQHTATSQIKPVSKFFFL